MRVSRNSYLHRLFLRPDEIIKLQTSAHFYVYSAMSTARDRNNTECKISDKQLTYIFIKTVIKLLKFAVGLFEFVTLYSDARF